MGSLGCLGEIEDVEAMGSEKKFKDAIGGVHLEYALAVCAIICDAVLFFKEVEGEDVSNTILVDMHLILTEISNLASGHDSTVAMDVDGMGSWTDICDVYRVGKEVNSALAIE